MEPLEIEGLPLLARKESDVVETPGRAKRLRRLLSSYTLRTEAGLEGGLEAYLHEALRCVRDCGGSGVVRVHRALAAH